MSVLQQQFMQLIDACDINDSDNDLLALLGVPAQASAVVMPDDGLAFTLPALPQAKQKRQSKAVPWVALALMSVLCVVILGGAAMTALSANSARAVAGLRVFHVTSNSMAPTANSNGNALNLAMGPMGNSNAPLGGQNPFGMGLMNALMGGGRGGMG